MKALALAAAVLALSVASTAFAALPGLPLDEPPATPPPQEESLAAAPTALDELGPADAPAISPAPLAPPRAALPEIAPGAVAAAAGGVTLALAAFGLYSRLARGQLLENKRRDEVFSLVKEQPGITLSDIASRTGFGWGTTVYHLERLEKGEFVTSEKTGARRCYFPVGAVPKAERAPLGALQQQTTRSVASYLVERPGLTQGEMAEALGLSASAASKQVSKLESAGLVRRERDWKTVRLHPQPLLAGLLRPVAALARA